MEINVWALALIIAASASIGSLIGIMAVSLCKVSKGDRP